MGAFNQITLSLTAAFLITIFLLSLQPTGATSALDQANILQAADRTSFDDKSATSSPRGREPLIGPIEWLFIWLVFVVIGVILGFRGTITIYRDFSDLYLTFAVFTIPIATFFLGLSNVGTWLLWTLMSLDALLLIWVAIHTYKDNTNVLFASLALYTKLSLSLIIVLKVFESWFPGGQTIREKSYNRAKALAVAASVSALAFRLVRNKQTPVRRSVSVTQSSN